MRRRSNRGRFSKAQIATNIKLKRKQIWFLQLAENFNVAASQTSSQCEKQKPEADAEGKARPSPMLTFRNANHAKQFHHPLPAVLLGWVV